MLFGLNSRTDAANVLDAFNTCLAIIEFLPDGTILTANDKFCAALGYASAELTGKHHGLLCEPDYLASAAYASFWQQLGAGKADSAEYLRRAKSGKKVWVKASYNPVKDRSGKVYKVVKVVTEVSESLSAFSPDSTGLDKTNVLTALDKSLAIIEFEPDGTIIWANDNFCGAMGYNLPEIQHQHHRMFCAAQYASSDDYKKFWKGLAGGHHQAAQYLRIGNGGKEVWIQATYNPVKDPAGKVYKVIKCATDISGRVASVNMIGEGLKELAANNLDFRLAEMKDPGFAELREYFNHSVLQQENSIIEVTNTARSIDRLVREIADASTDLAKRTEQQAAAVEQTNAAVSEVLNTVKLSSERASAANQDASEAGEVAAQSGVVMNEAIKAIKNIAQSSTEIGQIIGVIDEIAFQTNLLALNAGVEAARAGDAGRGFAVVAQEVRSLAQRSAQAAKEIKSLISNSSQQVTQGVALVDQSGIALSKIVTKLDEVRKQIAEIAKTSKQQAASLSEVVSAVSQIDQMTQHNAAMAEESTAAVVNVTNETRTLADMVAQFKTSETAHSHHNEVGVSQVKLQRSLSGNPIRTGIKQSHAANDERTSMSSARPKAVGDDWSEF